MKPHGDADAQAGVSPQHQPALGVLSRSDVVRLHDAALALLGDEAAAADRAVGQAPASFILAGRGDAPDVNLGQRRLWLAAGGAATELRRAGALNQSPSTMDLIEACRLAAALPDVTCVTCPPVRVPGMTTSEELKCCLDSTPLHLLLVGIDEPAEAEQAVILARQLSGGLAELRARPLLSLQTTSAGLGAALVFARAGLPVGLSAECPGSDPDQSAAGCLVSHHAGVLAACRAVQEYAPGAPFFYCIPPAHQLPLAGAENSVLFTLGALQLASHVGLPVLTAAMSTASADPGWDACSENALATLAAALASGAIVTGAGLLSSGRTFSHQQLVLDTELFSWNARIGSGIRVDDETIALATIKEVGIGGNYLGKRHTRRHMRDVWRPRLLDRTPWDAWAGSGEQGPLDLANALVERLLHDEGAESPPMTVVAGTSPGAEPGPDA